MKPAPSAKSGPAWLWAALAALCFGFVVVTPFEPNARKKVELFTLEVTVSGGTSGFVQLFYDIGAGFSEIDSVRILVEPSAQPVVYRFPIPSATYRLLRFDPTDHEETVTFKDFTILDGNGNVIRNFTPESFKPYHQIASLTPRAGGLEVKPTAGAGDPVLIVQVEEPFTLASPRNYAWSSHVRDGLIVAAIVFAGIWAFSRIRFLGTFTNGSLVLARRYPARALSLTAAFATVLSVYPVVFMGKSFVSPNFGTCLLYDQMPTLPGYRDTTLREVGASDVGAIMWQHVPYSMLQRDALFRDFELPLWNRYNSSGNTVLGQGQSSFGDPLHFIPILANGHAIAWDLKYLAAKWLFSFGLGLLVWTALTSATGVRVSISGAAPEGSWHTLAAALLVAVCTPFIGFFIFRVNHPGFFSLCYSPWIAYAWIRIVHCTTWRALSGWLSLLMLANWSELTSGTAKEAVTLLFGMNLTGTVVLFVSALSFKAKLTRFLAAVAAGVAFVALASPLWVTFLQTLSKSYTSYDAARVYQLQPGLFLTLFDEIFIRAFMEKQKVVNGSLNFLLFFGVAFALVRLRALWNDRLFRAFALAAVLPLLLVFGVIPPLWITQIPLMGNIAHLDNTFICVLIVQLSVIAGYGYRELIGRLAEKSGGADIAWAFALIFLVVAAYLGTTQAVQRTSRSYLHWGQTIQSDGFVYAYLVGLVLGLAVVVFSLRHLIQRDARSGAASVFLILGLLLTCWRHGWHAGNGFEDFVVHPTGRADFQAKSKALEPVLADRAAPFRVAGFQGNLFPGWTGAYRLEGICGPDALMNPHYRELAEVSGVERIWDWRFVLEAANLASQRPLYDMLGVKYYFDRRGDQGAMSAVLTPVIMADLEVYRSETAWPRAFFSRRIATYSSPSEIGGWIKSRPAPFAAMNREEANAAGLNPLLTSDHTGQNIAPARSFSLTTNRTEFVIDASGPGVAVLQETFVPGDFRATVNGKPADVLRVNHAFKGVAIPNAGTHVVAFEYWPERLTLALWISIFSGLCWLAACFLAPRLPAGWLDDRATKPA